MSENTKHPEKYADNGICFTDKEELFVTSDIVTFHCPLTEDTNENISEKNLDKMKDNVQIVNISRGGLVNEQDITEALNNSKVLSAGVDVV
ncbi:MAG: NAD(P)-dependent oxidoreductase [Methanosphaera sp.]|nr:NAD(P)-dependent oxidoreductase [Methanosphaera sp.]